MPMQEFYDVVCARCGQPGKSMDPGRWICDKCYREMEKSPRELLKHVGESLKEQYHEP